MTSESKAKKIILSHQTTPKVDVEQIAKDLGLKIVKREDWNDNISGMIRFNEQENIYEIHINNTHSAGRQRFTICHEIAHFIYHRNLIGNGITDDALFRSSLSNEKEVMANKLAADILMPWHLIRQQMEKGNNSIESLAEKFGVSKSAMAIRLGVPYYP